MPSKDSKTDPKKKNNIRSIDNARKAEPKKESTKESSKYRNVLKMPETHYPFEAGGGDLGEHRTKSPRLNTELGKYSLTEKQDKVLTFLREHIEQVGFPPTVRQIANYFNISAKAAHDHLRSIAKKGYLRLFPGAARGMEVVRQGDEEESSSSMVADVLSNTSLIPLVGSIAAGTPILAEENIDTHLSFPKAFMPTTGTIYALKVKGDSMENAGILDGDIAVMMQINDARTEVKNGDVVAALIEGDATLKTFLRKKNSIELVPENPRYKPIVLTERDHAMIVGKLIGVYRKYS